MKLIISGFFLLLAIYLPPSPRVPDEVKEAFRSGLAKVLAQYMEVKVALTLPDDDDIYPRAEVQKKLSVFFFLPISPVLLPYRLKGKKIPISMLLGF